MNIHPDYEILAYPGTPAEPLEPMTLMVRDVPKGWGSETMFANNDEFCGKLLKFKAKSQFSMHYHLKKREVFYVLEGVLRLEFFDLGTAARMRRVLEPGSAIEIPRGCPHKIYADTEATIIEVSTHHEDEDSYRVELGDSQRK